MISMEINTSLSKEVNTQNVPSTPPLHLPALSTSTLRLHTSTLGLSSSALRAPPAVVQASTSCAGVNGYNGYNTIIFINKLTQEHLSTVAKLLTPPPLHSPPASCGAAPPPSPPDAPLPPWGAGTRGVARCTRHPPPCTEQTQARYHSYC